MSKIHEEEWILNSAGMYHVGYIVWILREYIGLWKIIRCFKADRKCTSLFDFYPVDPWYQLCKHYFSLAYYSWYQALHFFFFRIEPDRLHKLRTSAVSKQLLLWAFAGDSQRIASSARFGLCLQFSLASLWCTHFLKYSLQICKWTDKWVAPPRMTAFSVEPSANREILQRY
jgi:hypothetical protein